MDFVEQLIEKVYKKASTDKNFEDNLIEETVKLCVTETARYLVSVDIYKHDFSDKETFWKYCKEELGERYEQLLTQAEKTE